MVEFIQIFGLPRTCTNVTFHFLKKNFPNLCFHKFNKHFPNECSRFLSKKQLDQTGFLLCCKHPYRWAVSIYDYWKCTISLKEFITGPPLEPLLESFGNTKIRKKCNNIISVYNEMNRHWLDSLKNNKYIVIKEEMHLEQEKIAQIISQKFYLKKPTKTRKISNKAGTAGKMTKEKYVPRKDITNEEILSIIKEKTDPVVLSKLGYSF
jgi:hypothetical protein